MKQKEFSKRLSDLRIQKGVSARDMSLSIGQSPSYINNIETGLGFSSMNMFFCICEFLEITPSDFFNQDIKSPIKYNELLSQIGKLNYKQTSYLIMLLKSFEN